MCYKEKQLAFVVLLITILLGQALWAVDDPLAKESVGRPLALGDAYSAFGSDANALFTSPAGLSDLSYTSLTSLYSQPIVNTNVLIAGGAVPSAWGTMALAYRNRTISNITVSTEVASYTDQDLTLLYSRQINESFSFGTDIRRLTRGLSKTIPSFEGLNGNATMLDLGLKYRHSAWLAAALTLRNLGGKITYQDGYTEQIGQNLILGLSGKLFGRDAYFPGSNKGEAFINLDLSKSTDDPLTLFHLGTEWWPVDYFALRAGVDQTPKSTTENYNNFCAGFGLKTNGLTFDYAYKKWANPAQAAAHYFSLGYYGPKPVEAKKPKPQLISLTDVPPGFWAKQSIEKLVAIGLLNYDQATSSFGPDRPVSRGETAMVLVRARDLTLPKEKKQVFIDVPVDFWAADYIQTSFDNKLTYGYPDKTYRPRNATTYAEIAAFITRLDSVSLRDVLERPLPDVPPTFWGIKEVLAAIDLGLFNYLGDEPFDPNKALLRSELAEMLTQTQVVKLKLKNAGLE